MSDEPRILICAGCMDECVPIQQFDGQYVSRCCGFGIIHEPTYLTQDELAQRAAELEEAREEARCRQ